MASDPYSNFANANPTAVGSATRHYSVTFDTELDPVPRALFFMGTGDVEIEDVDGNAEVYSLATAGVFPFRARRILSAGTTIAASKIKAWT